MIENYCTYSERVSVVVAKHLTMDHHKDVFIFDESDLLIEKHAVFIELMLNNQIGW